MNVRVESNWIYYLVQPLYYSEILEKYIWLYQVTMRKTKNIEEQQNLSIINTKF